MRGTLSVPASVILSDVPAVAAEPWTIDRGGQGTGRPGDFQES
jgi:hypothetical protein